LWDTWNKKTVASHLAEGNPLFIIFYSTDDLLQFSLVLKKVIELEGI
jgi:hypothetical protein